MGNSITTNSNLASLNAQRRLRQSTSELQSSFARLSSGLRINRASDDVVGLAISESLNVDAIVFTQGVRNLNDGLSALAVADAAIEELSGIAIRLQELAEQAANGTLGSSQRRALDEEAQTLKAEYLRIAQSTEFNERYLLRGDYGELALQGGYGQEGGITSGFGGAVGDGTFAHLVSYSTETYATYAISLGDLNGDGVLDMITAGRTDGDDGEATVFLGQGDGTFTELVSYSTEPFTSYDVTLGDLNGDGVLDMITAGRTDGDDGEATLFLGQGDGTFTELESFSTESNYSFSVSLGDLNGDGVLDLVSAGWNDASDGEATVFLGEGDGTFSKRATYSTETYSSYALSLGDLNGDGVLDMVSAGRSAEGIATVFFGQGDGMFSERASYSTESYASYNLELGDLNGDGVLDMVSVGKTVANDGEATVFLGQGDGTFSELASYSTESNTTKAVTLGDINGDGVLDMITAGRSDGDDGEATVFLGQGDGTFSRLTTFSTESLGSRAVKLGDLDGDGVLDLVSSGYTDSSDGEATVFLGNTLSGVAPLLDFSLATQADARQTLPAFQRKLSQLAEQRGQIGAFQARVEVAINNLQVEKENYITARSQITDADVAWESARLIRNNILQQAGVAVLAQANQVPALALMLLRVE